jgi:hypothetical protein
MVRMDTVHATPFESFLILMWGLLNVFLWIGLTFVVPAFVVAGIARAFSPRAPAGYFLRAVWTGWYSGVAIWMACIVILFLAKMANYPYGLFPREIAQLVMPMEFILACIVALVRTIMFFRRVERLPLSAFVLPEVFDHEEPR